MCTNYDLPSSKLSPKWHDKITTCQALKLQTCQMAEICYSLETSDKTRKWFWENEVGSFIINANVIGCVTEYYIILDNSPCIAQDQLSKCFFKYFFFLNL